SEPPSLPRDLPHDGAPRPEAREAAGPAFPGRGHRSRPLRHVGDGLPGPGHAPERDARAAGALAPADGLCPVNPRRLRPRVAARFAAIRSNDDVLRYRPARNLLGGEHLWLEKGLVPWQDLERLAASPAPGHREAG